jgi:F-type H+-transporting ATPase subunit a
MEIDITGFSTAEHFNIFGHEIVLFEGLIFIMAVLVVMLVLGLVLRSAVKHQDVNEKPSAVLVVAESLWRFAGGTTEGLDKSTHKKQLTAFAATLFVFMLLINTAALWGSEPPASNVFIAITLGLMVGLLVHLLGFAHSPKEYIKSFFQPSVLMFPINVMEVLSQIVSISMRLFGNMLAGIVLAALLKMALKALGPITYLIGYPIFGGLLSMYSDLFIATIQSLIFMTLTISYVKSKLLPE